MKKFPHFRVRNPLIYSAPKIKGRIYAYRNGVLTDITDGDPADPKFISAVAAGRAPELPKLFSK